MAHEYVLRVQVPRSSKLIFEDNDYSLYSVTLFKRVADSWKQAARSKGFQVIGLGSSPGLVLPVQHVVKDTALLRGQAS